MASARILIVEDEAASALLIKINLERWGYSVLGIEARGADAVKTALAKKPDLLIMDIFLADNIDGIDAVKSIHQEIKIPVIYVTASDDPITREKADETDFIDYITKPYLSSELKKVLDSHFHP